MSLVVQFVPVEPIIMDRRRLLSLCHDVGLRSAEAHLFACANELGDAIMRIRGVHCNGGVTEMIAVAQELSEGAGQIGLTTLARVARDVAVCARSGDGVAFAAVWARFERIGDRSLRHLWRASDIRL